MYIGIAIGFAVGYLVARLVHKGNFYSPEEALFFGKMGNEAIRARIERRKAKIMKLAYEKGRLVNDDVEEMFCITHNTASNYLGELSAEGKLVRHGEAGGTYYTPV